MTLLLILFGCLLLAGVFADAITTTLLPGAGGGPLTRAFSGFVWRGLLGLSHRLGSRSVLTAGGPVVLLSTVLVWVVLLWGGWSLVFVAGDGAVVDSHSRAPATAVQTVYFAGFTIFTLGIGDYVPTGGGWEIVTTVASFSGLFLVTLSITYLLSVLTAVVSGRRFAASLHLYGDTGADLVLLYTVDGSLDEGLADRLGSLAEEVVASAQQHLAYPVLHFFSPTDERSSTPRALAALDDALLLTAAGLAQAARPRDATLLPLRRALDFYVETVGTRIVTADDEPPAPDLSPLRQAGLPVVDDQAFAEAVAERAAQRVQMLRLLVSDGRRWPVAPVAREVTV